MNQELFTSLIQNLLHTNVVCCKPEENAFADFADKYCYHILLQPQFTAEALFRAACAAKENTIYESRDETGIWIQFFRMDESIFIVGPYVKQVFDSARIQRAFADLHIPAAYAESFRLYYSAFPLINSTQVRNTIIACIHSLTGLAQEYATCRTEFSKTEPVPPNTDLYTESLDYSTVYSRYDLENTFLNKIESGDTEQVLIAYEHLSGQGLPKSRYANAVYQDPAIAMSMVRALARKAAERGGASVIEINEITQRAVQHMLSAKNALEQDKYCKNMIYELTDTVRRHRLALGNYSGPVRKILEYIQFNYSQKMSLSFLAGLANCSPSYLSKEFKKATGATIFDYIAHLRCARAAEMLRDTDATVQAVSSFVGYLDNNYFVKVFRKEYGTTPSEYRTKKRLEKDNIPSRK
ncbi:MAG: AraC family transcriptional regulator [Roseburia sp.]|nr:AraC family transcriptional regulator [Roseburia sp.]MCM1099398.1 AraC family transcriptional regulator [Ruminococcus flavefaciens]